MDDFSVDAAPAAPETRPGTWDHVTEGLIRLRHAQGDPSFTDIAERVARARRQAGQEPAASRVARSTVYDCFRLGRRRINIDLVREIVRALDSDDAVVRTWLDAGARAPEAAPEPEPAAMDDAVPEVGASPPPAPEGVRSSTALALIAACVAVNLLGRLVVDGLGLQVYLDMVGTAVAAIALGPWRGAAVGVLTNVVGVTISGGASLAFAVVNVAGALVWGYGVRRFGLGRSMPRFFALNVLVALTCSLVAVPILVLAFDGGTGHSDLTDTFRELGNGLLLAVGLSNMLTSTVDKLLSGFVALAVVASVPRLVASPHPLPFLEVRSPE